MNKDMNNLHSKLAFNNVNALLTSYPLKRIKQFLRDKPSEEVITEIMNQNKSCLVNLVAGRDSDDAALAAQGAMEKSVREHVQHIELTGRSLLDAPLPVLDAGMNLMQVLEDARENLGDASPYQCRYEWNAMLRQELPVEMAVIKSLNEGKELSTFDYKHLVHSPMYTNLLAKTRSIKAEQSIAVQAVNKARSSGMITDSMADSFKLAIHPSDEFARHQQGYCLSVVSVLGQVILHDDALRSVAGLLTPIEIDAVSTLNVEKHMHSTGTKVLEKAVCSVNIERMYQMQLTLKQEAEEAARLEAERIEQQEAEELQRNQDAMNFAADLANEQRKLVLADKVRDGSISVDELTEYKELNRA